MATSPKTRREAKHAGDTNGSTSTTTRRTARHAA